MGRERETGPQVTVEQALRSPGPAAGHWLMSWRIRNLGQESLELLTARLPHSRFRSEEKKLVLRSKLPPGESTPIELAVLCREPPGSVADILVGMQSVGLRSALGEAIMAGQLAVYFSSNSARSPVLAFHEA